MPVLPRLAAAALILALPAASLANPAQALSITRAGPILVEENALTKGEIYPLAGLTLLAVLAIVLLSDKVDTQEPDSA